MFTKDKVEASTSHVQSQPCSSAALCLWAGRAESIMTSFRFGTEHRVIDTAHTSTLLPTLSSSRSAIAQDGMLNSTLGEYFVTTQVETQGATLQHSDHGTAISLAARRSTLNSRNRQISSSHWFGFCRRLVPKDHKYARSLTSNGRAIYKRSLWACRYQQNLRWAVQLELDLRIKGQSCPSCILPSLYALHFAFPPPVSTEAKGMTTTPSYVASGSRRERDTFRYRLAVMSIDNSHNSTSQALGPPTAFLPPLARMQTHSKERIAKALHDLERVYWHCNHDHPKPNKTSPDSGYASAEDEELLQGASVSSTPSSFAPNEDAAETIRSDPFERAFAIKWLTGFIARFDGWVEGLVEGQFGEQGDSDPTGLFELATEMLVAFMHDDSAGASKDDEEYGGDDDVITRPFVFPVWSRSSDTEQIGEIRIELQDKALSDTDHTCVGLQSWGSAILMGEMLCADPRRFFGGSAARGFDITPTDATHRASQRVLELGAGTGMLSILTAKLVQQGHIPQGILDDWNIVTTDYHPDVLANLKKNIEVNISSASNVVSARPISVSVEKLDWNDVPGPDSPATSGQLGNTKFDLILAADVVYHPEHPALIKGCVEKMLKVGGVFWMMVTLRKTGRHNGLEALVDDCFQSSGADSNALWRLAVLEREEIIRGSERKALGRADESGYMLYKIGWIEGN